jgi:hypothetical protein
MPANNYQNALSIAGDARLVIEDLLIPVKSKTAEAAQPGQALFSGLCAGPAGAGS